MEKKIKIVKDGPYIVQGDIPIFEKIIAGAVFDARVNAWAVGRFGGGIDHPLLMTYPEGEYLKGLHLLVRP